MITLETVPPEMLGWALLALVCCPLLIPFLMTRRRAAAARHRPARRPWLLARLDKSTPAGPVATTADPLQLLGFVDRAGPAPFDVERFDGPDPRAGQHLSDAEVVAVAEALNGPGERWSATPNADDVEDWLADLTRRRNTP